MTSRCHGDFNGGRPLHIHVTFCQDARANLGVSIKTLVHLISKKSHGLVSKVASPSTATYLT